MSGLAAIVGAVSGYANAKNAQQNEDYKDARLKSIMSGGKIPMPEKPKSLGSQLMDKVKDNLPTFGYDGNTSNYAKTPDDSNSSSEPVELKMSDADEFGKHFNSDSTGSDTPEPFKSSV